ncbi:hypothetical protein MRX96_045151 [Rhipicephalus microplus]
MAPATTETKEMCVLRTRLSREMRKTRGTDVQRAPGGSACSCRGSRFAPAVRSIGKRRITSVRLKPADARSDRKYRAEIFSATFPECRERAYGYEPWLSGNKNDERGSTRLVLVPDYCDPADLKEQFRKEIGARRRAAALATAAAGVVGTLDDDFYSTPYETQSRPSASAKDNKVKGEAAGNIASLFIREG